MKKSDPPKYLNADAAKAWEGFTKQIANLKRSDHAALAMLCQAFVTMHNAQAQLDAQGEIIRLPNGFNTPNPWAKVRRDARTIVVRLLKEFHLTPASRDAMPAAPDKGWIDFDSPDFTPVVRAGRI